MKSTPKTVHIAEPLWRALEAMSDQMGVDTDALLNQAVYTLARLNGFINPPQIKPTDEAASVLEPIAFAPAPGKTSKPGPPVPTPPQPVATAPAAQPGPPPSPPAPPTLDAPAPAPAAARAEVPAGPSEAERAGLRAKAVEQMKSIAEEVERVVNVLPDAPMEASDDEDDDDGDLEEQDESDEEEDVKRPAASEGEADAEEASEEEPEASDTPEASDAPEGSEEPDESSDTGEQAAPPEDAGAEASAEEDAGAEGSAAADDAGSIQDDLEALGMGRPERPAAEEDDGEDLSPLPAEDDAPEGIPTALVRPKPARPADEELGIATAGVRVEAMPGGKAPRRPDGAEELNVTGTVRRLAVQLPKDEEPEEPQERTQIVRHERTRLFIIRGGADPVEIVSERYLIGRGPHCDLVIESNRVSREHAAVLAGDDGFVIEDLGSSNGTWFNQERVQKHVIQDGDEIFFGNEAVRFTLEVPKSKRGARRDGRVQA